MRPCPASRTLHSEEAIPTTRDDARTDLFLAGGVYWIGPIVIGLLLGLGPGAVVQRGGLLLGLAIVLVTTVLVPALLMRYRSEPVADYLGKEPGRAFAAGLVAGLPAMVVGGGLAVAQGAAVLNRAVALGAVRWVAVCLLGGYVVVKARDAFASVPIPATEGVAKVARIVALVAAVSALLLVAGLAVTRNQLPIPILLSFVAVPGAVALGALPAARQLKGATGMPTLLAPTILLPLGSVFLTFNLGALLGGIFIGAVYAAVGLTIAILSEVHRSVAPAAGLGIGLAFLALIGF